MAVELFEGTNSSHIAPETRDRARNYYSDREDTRTPPPDYDTFLSDNDLPSVRTRLRMENGSLKETSSRGDYNRSVRNYHTSHENEESSFMNESERSSVFDENMTNDEDTPLILNDNRKHKKKERLKKIWNIVRIASLTLFVVVSIVLFSINGEREEEYVLASAQTQTPYSFELKHTKTWYSIKIHLLGPFRDMEYLGSTGSNKNSSGLEEQNTGLAYNCSTFIVMCVHNETSSDLSACEVIEEDYYTEQCVSVQLIDDNHKLYFGEHSTDDVIKRSIQLKKKDQKNLHFHVSQDNVNVHFEFAILGEILSETVQIILAGLVLLVVYVLIVFDLVHRTVAAMIGSTAVIGVLSMLNKRPTLETVVEWISLETLCLLFGMMVLVAIFSQTGIFDYFAVKAYKIARGKVWPLITLLCLFSAFVSAFLDNVTTILLLTPVSIRLCQVLNLDPVPILIAEVLFSNIGGTATAVGDPPNVIIISHPLITTQGINFAEFTLHLLIGIIFCMITGYGLLVVYYYILYVGRRDTDPPHIAELKREIAIWERTARLMPVVSLEERAIRDALRSKGREVREQLKEARNHTLKSAVDVWRKNLEELESRYRITDRVLLIKSLAVLSVVILMFFFSHFIPGIEVNLGWIAIFGALALLLLADVQELESVLHKVEWGTLLFFAGLFVLMEGLGELGLIDFIGKVTVNIIKNVHEDDQLLVAIILLLWVSAVVSSFIDNIPFTQAMIPVIVKMADSPDVCLPLKPLVWTLAFGACLGGNGTLIGASANVVCAGLAEQNGYKITFNGFFKMGFPMMIVTTLTIMIYLIICHIVIGWNVQQCNY